MKFFLLAVIFFCIVTAFIVTGAAFVKWDIGTFNIGGWEPWERICMIMLSICLSLGLAEAAS